MSVASKPERVINMRRSETENSTVLVCLQRRRPGIRPTYVFKLHAFDQPFLELYRYPIAEKILVGDARSSPSTSDIRLTMGGKEYTLTTDANNNSFGLEGCDEGELRWLKSSDPTNRELELVDHTGRLLARLKVSRFEQKRLELYAECTDNLLALMLLSGLVVVDAIFQRIPLHWKGEAKVILSSPGKGGIQAPR
ncbi:hypothetical protein GGI42DRAFT_324643, partial [Trichoderma sp. SZMC 28013]